MTRSPAISPAPPLAARKALGARLRAAREEFGQTLEQLSVELIDHCGIQAAPSFLAGTEAGHARHGDDWQRVVVIARWLGVGVVE